MNFSDIILIINFLFFIAWICGLYNILTDPIDPLNLIRHQIESLDKSRAAIEFKTDRLIINVANLYSKDKNIQKELDELRRTISLLGQTGIPDNKKS